MLDPDLAARPEEPAWTDERTVEAVAVTPMTVSRVPDPGPGGLEAALQRKPRPPHPPTGWGGPGRAGAVKATARRTKLDFAAGLRDLVDVHFP